MLKNSKAIPPEQHPRVEGLIPVHFSYQGSDLTFGEIPDGLPEHPLLFGESGQGGGRLVRARIGHDIHLVVIWAGRLRAPIGTTSSVPCLAPVLA